MGVRPPAARRAGPTASKGNTMSRLARLLLVSMLGMVVSAPAHAGSFWFYLGSGAFTPVPCWVHSPWQFRAGYSGSGWWVCIGSCRVHHCPHRAGWTKLRGNDWRGARDQFQARVNQRPDDASAWLGLSLAQLTGGQDLEGELAMRRAVRLGFRGAVRGMPVREFEPLLRGLEQRSTALSSARPRNWFTAAALRTIRQDRAGAIRATEQAMRFNRYDADSSVLMRMAREGR